MNYYDPYDQPDPEEERRLQMAAMDSFANRQPIEQTMGRYTDQPEPDAERAAAVLEAPSQHSGPTPRELEDDAVRAVRDSYGQKKSFFDQGGGAAIAAAIDLFVNKGRDIGTIAGGYAQGRQRADADDKDSMRQMAKLEIQRAQETQHDKERSEIGEINKGNLAARNEEDALARERFNATKGDPETDRAYKAALTNEAEARAYGAWTGDDKAITPYQQAQLDAQKTYHDDANKDRDAAREDAKSARGEQAALREEMRKARELQQTIVNTDREDKAYQGQLNKFRDETEKTRPQVQRMKQMDDIMNKPQYADDIPGIGAGSYIPGFIPDALRGGHENASDARTMQSATADIADLLGRQRSGAAIPPAEYAKMQQFITAGEHATDQQFKDAYSAYHKVLSAELTEQTRGREKAAREVLGSEMGNYMMGPEYTPPPAVDQLPPDRITGPVTNYGGGRTSPPAGDVLPTQPRDQMPRVNQYLKRLQLEDDDLGVGYR